MAVFCGVGGFQTALPLAMDLAECFLIDVPLYSTYAQLLQSRIG